MKVAEEQQLQTLTQRSDLHLDQAFSGEHGPLRCKERVRECHFQPGAQLGFGYVARHIPMLGQHGLRNERCKLPDGHRRIEIDPARILQRCERCLDVRNLLIANLAFAKQRTAPHDEPHEKGASLTGKLPELRNERSLLIRKQHAVAFLQPAKSALEVVQIVEAVIGKR